ncbi:unnamed protein product [Closterium sp. NIES-65]|nr:unnamed protein product [Closterium sp. NIES-65]
MFLSVLYLSTCNVDNPAEVPRPYSPTDSRRQSGSVGRRRRRHRYHLSLPRSPLVEFRRRVRSFVLIAIIMVLSRTTSEDRNKEDAVLEPVFANRYMQQPVKRHVFPADEMSREVAYQIVADMLEMDGKPRLNPCLPLPSLFPPPSSLPLFPHLPPLQRFLSPTPPSRPPPFLPHSPLALFPPSPLPVPPNPPVRHVFPADEMPREVAYQIVADMLEMDGKPRLNLASFVTTWMEPDAERLMTASLNKNAIDLAEYPACAHIQELCLNMLARLYHAPLTEGQTAVGTATIGSSEAIMLAGLAMKRRWVKFRKDKGLPTDSPNLVVGANTHVVVEKFANYFDVELRMVPVTPECPCLRVGEAVKLCDERTIGVVPILGSTYTGHFEDVQGLDEALRKLDLPHGWVVGGAGWCWVVLGGAGWRWVVLSGAGECWGRRRRDGWSTIGVVPILGSKYTGHFEDVQGLDEALRALELPHGWDTFPSSSTPLPLPTLPTHSSLPLPLPLFASPHLPLSPSPPLPPSPSPHLPLSPSPPLPLSPSPPLSLFPSPPLPVSPSPPPSFSWQVPIHVDAASGGFIAPFLYPSLAWDFRLPSVLSISVSGHKYGLTYPGIAWLLFRNDRCLPQELIYHVDYLGEDQPTFTLNFSRGGCSGCGSEEEARGDVGAAQIVGQYYQSLRLGFKGYRRVMENCAEVADSLREQLEATGMFHILSDTNMGIPLVAFRFKPHSPYVHLSERELSDDLRRHGWILPSYQMPPNMHDVTVLRVCVREDFSRELADWLVRDIKETVVRMKAHEDKARARDREMEREGERVGERVGEREGKGEVKAGEEKGGGVEDGGKGELPLPKSRPLC